MKTRLLRCKKGQQFHAGRITVDVENALSVCSPYIHSDTLFSAIVNLCQKIDNEQVATVIDWFKNEKVSVSSIFYALKKGENTCLFLPKPIFYNAEKYEGLDKKAVKNIEFISLGIWNSGIEAKDWFKNTDSATQCCIIQDKFVCLFSELANLGLAEAEMKTLKVYNMTTVPKVAVHKVDKENSFYFQTNVQLAENQYDIQTHLFFLEDNTLENEAEQRLWEKLLHFLPYEGIGGERSTGCGIFDDLIDLPFEMPTKKSAIISLSLAIPDSKEEFAAFQNYNIIERGGRRIADDDAPRVSLKRVKMIKEGASLSTEIKGNIVNISYADSKTYLRNGKCFLLPY